MSRVPGIAPTPAAVAVRVARNARGVVPGWHRPGDPGEPVFQNGWQQWTGAHQARYYAAQDGQVFIAGHVYHPGPIVPSVVFTLPLGYRPAYNLIVQSNSYWVWTIRANGEVYVTRDIPDAWAPEFRGRWFI
ncbi:MAG: hypothetical protein M3355_12150 [Actinomycetota bacterium]|nr:hypothetical protein [Actinomycetota bacterium]